MGHQLSLSFALPHPFPGWSLCVSRQLSTPISTLKGAEQRQAGEPISQRVDRCLERQRWLEQDTESVLLNPTEDTDAAPIQREGGPAKCMEISTGLQVPSTESARAPTPDRAFMCAASRYRPMLIFSTFRKSGLNNCSSGCSARIPSRVAGRCLRRIQRPASEEE